MRPLTRLSTAALVAACLVSSGLARAQDGAAAAAGPRLCFAELDVKGLPKRARLATHQKIVQELTRLGATIPVETHGMAIERDCLGDPSCVVWALESVKVDGVLVVRAQRIKRKVQVSVLLYDGNSGHQVFDESFSVKKGRFPRRTPLGAVLGRGLEALRQRRATPPATDAPAAMQPATAPPPSAPTAAPVAEVRPAPRVEQAPKPLPTPNAGDDPGTLLAVTGWSFAGLGAVALLSGGVTGGLALQKDLDLKTRCDQTTMQCASDVGEDYAQMRNLALMTDILLGIGAVAGLFGGGTLAFALVAGGGAE